MPLPLYAQGKSPEYPLDRRLGGPQSWSGRRGEEKILDPTRAQTPTSSAVQPIASYYTDYAIPAPHWGSLQWNKEKQTILLTGITRLCFKWGTVKCVIFQCLSLTHACMSHCTTPALWRENVHFITSKQWNTSNHNVNSATHECYTPVLWEIYFTYLKTEEGT
jgi:hypothetical protein